MIDFRDRDHEGTAEVGPPSARRGLDDFRNVFGFDGDDVLSGEGNVDMIYGGLGDDQLDGGKGSDELRGESGTDVCSGGTADPARDLFAGCERVVNPP